MEWAHHGIFFREELIELMCEGLGVRPGKLKELRCTESRILLGQFYPYCPQPDLTAGIVPHTDHTLLTVMVQDQIGGLQVKRENKWVNVVPVEGAVTINIISNDKYKNVEHRVLANRSMESRISVPLLFHPAGVSNVDDDSSYYGPLPELLSAETPPCYKDFTLAEFWKQSQSKAICSKNLTSAFSTARDDENLS
ncbi:1-aminocyclopropane-1-carboxylate oxidase homolog 5-like [Papaver somniferum]|uniref:1-aminocyclopropane-1-carboxylate oxidase homolog 5-like n=1 Tax=Papaver somniferum TaxID=3469 RepID=UPI000E6F7D80|nr:1-aminocyclopropane-1-carboxylate oxidase homolog 5-like [Papaver somniferum]